MTKNKYGKIEKEAKNKENRSGLENRELVAMHFDLCAVFLSDLH